MTREELIQLLITLKMQSRIGGNGTFVTEIKPSSFIFVINSAIKALKDESYTLWKESYEVELNKNNRLERQLEDLRKETQWIPVSEELPEVSVSVIGITASDDIYIADLYDFCGKKEWYANGCYDVPIVAWMPLPEPYKESEDKI